MNENRNRFVLSMLAYAVQRDVAVEELCKRSNLDLKKLKNGSLPDITQKQLNDLWVNASFLTNDRLFGLHFGESLQLAALGFVGEIIKSSATVGEALTHGASLIHLITDVFRIDVVRKHHTFVVQLKTMKKEKDTSFSFMQMRDLIMVFLIHELDGLLLRKIRPESLTLAVDPEHILEYERVLRCRPSKEGSQCAVELKLGYWNEPILSSNFEVQAMLLKSVKSNNNEKKQLLLRERIQSYLLSNSFLGILTLEEVAANFSLSQRSLQRKLHSEGATFQQLADDVRRSVAEHYLTSGEYKIKEISNILGYNEMSAFSRAFKRWTGKSPNAFQA